MEDLVNKLRCYAEDLHSAGGFNGYASAMSQAADEIVKLREYVAMMEADLIATIEQRDALQLRIEEENRDLRNLLADMIRPKGKSRLTVDAAKKACYKQTTVSK